MDVTSLGLRTDLALLVAAGSTIEDCAGSGLARFQSVETHPSFRGRGLAGTLLHHVGSFGLGDRGARTLVIVADPDDTAIRLYEAVGFRATETTLQAERWPGWDTPGGG